MRNIIIIIMNIIQETRKKQNTKRLYMNSQTSKIKEIQIDRDLRKVQTFERDGIR